VKPSKATSVQLMLNRMTISRRLLVLVSLSCLLLSAASTLVAQDSGELPQAAIDRAANIAAASVVQIETIGGLDQVGDRLASTGPTTGTVLSEEGWIVSSSFSFEQLPAAIIVRTPDGERQAAKLIARDTNRSLVLLKTDPNPQYRAITPATLSDVKVGQTAIALGKVFDPARPSASLGIVSATGRIWGKAIQTDARISPNNYGGPLIDLQGNCLGILAPINPGDGSGEDGSQWYDSGIGFAASIDQVMRSLETMKSGTDVSPGRLGVTLSVQDDYSGPLSVAGAAANSPAAAAGLKRGDRIVSINGQPIEILAHLKTQLGQLNAGELANIKVKRGDEELDIACTLAAEIPPYRLPYLGLIATATSEKILVRDILPESPASGGGIMAGDQILEINNSKINDLKSLRELVQTLPLDKAVSLKVLGTDGNEKSVTVTPVPWPTDPVVKLAENKNSAQPAAPNPGTGVVELPLGDVANKLFAFVPPGYQADVPHGVIVLLPEAGEIDQRVILDQWEPLCRNHRWILAVLTAADGQGWKPDEIELVGRTLTLLQTNYNVDPGRVVSAGIRSAGPLAAVAAFTQRTKFNGLLILGGGFPARMRLEGGQPLECIRSLIISDKEGINTIAEKLTESGHPTSTMQGEVAELGKLEPAVAEVMNSWLRGLERL